MKKSNITSISCVITEASHPSIIWSEIYCLQGTSAKFSRLVNVIQTRNTVEVGSGDQINQMLVNILLTLAMKIWERKVICKHRKHQKTFQLHLVVPSKIL